MRLPAPSVQDGCLRCRHLHRRGPSSVDGGASAGRPSGALPRSEAWRDPTGVRVGDGARKQEGNRSACGCG